MLTHGRDHSIVRSLFRLMQRSFKRLARNTKYQPGLANVVRGQDSCDVSGVKAAVTFKGCEGALSEDPTHRSPRSRMNGGTPQVAASQS